MDTRRFAIGAALALAITSLPGGVAASGDTADRGTSACGGVSGGPVATHAASRVAAVAAASSATPAGGVWTSTPIATLRTSGSEGGFAVADDQHATIVATDGDAAWARQTADAGATWDPPVRLTPFGWAVLSGIATQQGSDVEIANAAYKGDRSRTFMRHSADGGATWGSTLGLPGSVYGPVLAIGAGGLVVLSATPDPTVRVRISRDGGASFGRAVRVGAYDIGAGCVYDPGYTALAVSGGVVLVFHWQNEKKLIVHRSTDGGRTWGAARMIRAGQQGSDPIATAVNGDTVLVAFHSGQDLVIRRSTDRGLTWSPPFSFKSGGWGVSLARADGQWHLVYTHGHALRYRSSVNGLDWTAEETVATYPAADSSRPLGVGILGGTVVAPWIHSFLTKDNDGLEFSARS